MSRAKFHFQQAELDQMLTEARLYNEAHGVTGMLLYDGFTTFIQVIEGDQEKIDCLYELIARDPRHEDVVLISYHSISNRSFPDWQMAYKRIGPSDNSQLPGFSDFMLTEKISTEAKQSYALDILNHFKKSTL